MKCNFIHIKLKDENKINKNKNLELFKLSIGNSINNLNYNINNKKYSNKNFEIFYNKIFQKKILEK